MVFAAVKAIILDKDKFLVIKQTVGELVFWDLPGGRVDYGESPYETLLREVEEEAGLNVAVVKPVGFWWFFRKIDENQVVCTTFICKPRHDKVDITKNPIPEENITEFRWVTKEEFLSDQYKVSHESLKKLISEKL